MMRMAGRYRRLILRLWLWGRWLWGLLLMRRGRITAIIIAITVIIMGITMGTIITGITTVGTTIMDTITTGAITVGTILGRIAGDGLGGCGCGGRCLRGFFCAIFSLGGVGWRIGFSARGS